MKKFYLLIVMLLGVSGVMGQAANWDWVKGIGGYSYDLGTSIAVDASGNSYLTGTFFSNSIIAGNDTLINVDVTGNTGDLYIIKYDVSGNVVWAKSFGGNQTDWGLYITMAGNSTLYLTGWFYSSTISFGSATISNTGGGGNADFFIAKLDSSGNFTWAHSAGSSYNDNGTGIAIDANENIYVTGNFAGYSISFGSTVLTNAASGNFDMFIVKYDSSGIVIWAKKAGGTDYDLSYSISSGAAGNFFITGFFTSPTIVFGSTILTNFNYNSDMFVAKYDSSGNPLWAKRAGGYNSDEGRSTTVDPSGNLYVLGDFSSHLIHFGGTTLTNDSANYSDIFIVKYSSTGNVIWAKSFEGTYNDFGNNIISDGYGNIYITGGFQGPVIQFGGTPLTNSGNHVTDVYVARLDSFGNVIWAKSAGGINDDDDGSGMGLDLNGNLYLAGSIESSSAAFGNIILTNAGGNSEDIFIAKLDNTTGIVQKENPLYETTIYPNPAASLLTVRGNEKDEVVRFRDVMGKEFYTIKVAAFAKTNVDVSKFPNVFFIRRESGEVRKMVRE